MVAHDWAYNLQEGLKDRLQQFDLDLNVAFIIIEVELLASLQKPKKISVKRIQWKVLQHDV